MTLANTPGDPVRERDGRIVKVAIVDDSLVARRVLERILASDGRFHINGSYPSAERTLEALPTNPVDVLLLDLEMPGRGGLGSLPDLIETGGATMAVVILSGHHFADGEIAMAALANGARDVLAKPTAGHFHAAFGATLCDRLHAIATGQDGTGWKCEKRSPPIAQSQPATPPRAIAIGASTGGIAALAAFFRVFRPAPVPIFITQHLPADFMPFFARQLSAMTTIPVELARSGSRVMPGRIYVATGDAHLTVERGTDRNIRILQSRQGSRHGAFPAVDPMFAALASIYRDAVHGVILSGMGRDGLSGAQAIVSGGGTVLAQDSQTSVVWGMPGAVVASGLATLVAAPERLAEYINERWKMAA